jgi:hypothetical protein
MQAAMTEKSILQKQWFGTKCEQIQEIQKILKSDTTNAYDILTKSIFQKQ